MSRNLQSQNSQSELNEALSNSPTLLFLQGQISFQDYQNYVENQQLQHDFATQSELVASNVVEISTGLTEAETIVQAPRTSGYKRLKSASESSASSTVKKKSKLPPAEDDDDDDDDDDIENMIEMEAKAVIGESDDDFDPDDDEDDENNEEAIRWKDFDIETLNFDKFISDYSARSTSGDSADETGKSASAKAKAKQQSDAPTTSGFGKRKKSDKKDADQSELRTKRRRNRVLPPEIQGLMGEANLAYARGETNRAIDVCLEVIKYAPKASEPFQLLSLLYSEMGQNDKALRVGLVSAQLNKDPDEWIELIQQAMMEGDVDLVLFCYNNAIQCDPTNIDLHIERVRILEEQKDDKRLLLAKLMLLKYCNINTNLDIYNKYFNQVMSELDRENDRYKKIYVLKTDMKKFQDKFPVSRLIMLIKLMIGQKAYKDSILIMMNQLKMDVRKGGKVVTDQFKANLTEAFSSINDYEFDLPIDCDNYVRALFAVCLIHLGFNKEQELLNKLYDYDVEKCAAPFLLLANTYYDKQDYPKAKFYFYLLLTNVREYMIQLDIWLKYGNCCNNLNEIDDAISAYRNAVNLDSSNCEAALCLVSILKKNKKLFDEASSVIRTTLNHEKSKKLTTEVLNLMINECLIQYEKGIYSHFINSARNLLFSHIIRVLDPENVNALLKADSKVQRAIVFHQILESNNYLIEFAYAKLNPAIQDTVFEVFLKLCKTLVKLKRHEELLIYSVGATVLPMVYERNDWNKAINFACLIACILKNDGKNGFNILKDFIIEFKNSNKLWSYAGIIIGLYPSLNQQKFFIRLGAKYMDHLPLCLINAHFAIMSGTYRYALVEYMNCFKQNPSDPFINLIISITYCHISCQKYNTKRHLLVSQSLVFLRRYMKLRGACQESYYNAARVFHQLSLFDLAAHYYQKCLQSPCYFPEQEEIYSLKRYAAYNLISIYKHSGSFALARQIMIEHLTV